jgi:hypothetical protein
VTTAQLAASPVQQLAAYTQTQIYEMSPMQLGALYG